MEELLKELEDKEESLEVDTLPEQHYLDEIIAFVNTLNLKPGTNVVRSASLYKLYKNFSEDPISQLSFTNRIHNYLPGEGGRVLINLEATVIGEHIFKGKRGPRCHSLNKKYKRSIEDFLENCDVKPGKFYIETYILFEMYAEWVRLTQRPVIVPRHAVSQLLAVYLPSKKLDHHNTRLNYLGIERSQTYHYLTDEKIVHLRKMHAEKNERKRDRKRVFAKTRKSKK